VVCLALTAHAAPAGASSTAERFVPRSTAKHFQLGAGHFPFGAGKPAEIGGSDVTSPAMRSLDTVVDLRGPGPGRRCNRVVEGMRRDGRVVSVEVQPKVG
jgi:hypothetical protein